MTRLEGWDNPKADVSRLVRSWLCDESNGRWVIIVDNADDPSVFFPPADRIQTARANGSYYPTESLSNFLPQSSNGSILITSRSRDVAFRLTGSSADIIPIDPMDQAHALALLRNKLGVSFEQDDAVALVEALDYMPLAITQAAAYINQRAPRTTVYTYLRNLKKGDRDRAKLLEKDVGDFRRDGTASNSIIATWQISFEHIRGERPSATRLLSLMSLFDRQGIPEFLLDGRDQEDNDASSDFEEDLNTLTNYSLIAMDGDGRQFEMHRLVQFSTRKWLELRGELEDWKEKYVTLMDDSYPVGRHENWTVCRALFPHAQAAVASRPAGGSALEVWASIFFKAGWYASEMGNYQTAKEMGQIALEARKATLGMEHPDTLNSMNNLASTYRDQGRWKEAEELEVQVIETRKRVFGAEHPDTLTSMANLASTYQDQGRWKEAEELEVQVIETSSRVLGAEHPDTLISMANLASTYQDQGRWKEAEELEVQVMETSLRVLRAEHPDTLTSMANLASTFWKQGRWKEAEELEAQVMETSSRVLGAEHPDTLTSMANLASTFLKQGRWKEAEELEVQVIKTRKRVLGAEHPGTLTSMNNLASTYRDQGRWKEAEELEVQVIKTRKRVLGAEYPDTLTSIANLASTYKDQGRWKEAEELFMQVIEARKRVVGVEHPDMLTSIANLASTYKDQGRWKEAEELFMQVIEARKRVLGAEHPDTLTSLNNLASIFKFQGRNGEAISLMEKCFQLRKQILGSQHPHTESSRKTLNEWEDGEH
jgi:tetratricopeptide (TPR) repeat protein